MPMHSRRRFLGTACLWAGLSTIPAVAADREWRFDSIDGGVLSFSDWAGQPVLVVNTASRCGFTKQYDGLQALYDEYRDQGLVVLAVPSQDFKQELASDEQVAEFCEVNFNLTLPMTTITRVRGPEAHPFYKWLAEAEGFTPSWNFTKVLIGPDGKVVNVWGSATRPRAQAITRAIEPLLNRS